MKSHYLIPIVGAFRGFLYKINAWYVNKYHLQGKAANGFKPNYPIVIKGGINIVIGAYFRSLGPAYLNANDGKLDIGNHCFLNRNVHIDAFGGHIKIGDDVLIGQNSVIRASNHKFSRGDLIRNQGHISGSIVIEDDVWIGANCVLLPDIRLHSGSIIGAGSVVTRDVGYYEIFAGVPAKKIGIRH